MKNIKDDLKDFPNIDSCNVSIIGLGYVGLPLAYELAKYKSDLNLNHNDCGEVIGFDINQMRIDQLNNGIDKTGEIDNKDLLKIKFCRFTSRYMDLINSDVFIITVPTPLKNSNQPDFKALKSASEIVGNILKERTYNDKNKLPVVIYESTVYPGATEEICLPILIKSSGLKLYKNEKEDSLAIGYSPERINPGDKKNRLIDIVKVTSGACEKSSLWIDQFYKTIIKAGTYRAKSIKIAESSKVIENVQRDLNIAIVNEFALIFNKLSIDTLDVLEAANTKWNFLDFKPGLVGGHCIGVDPYYLTYKAKKIGYYPDLISSGRRLNNGMGIWIAEQIIIEMATRSISVNKSKILILGVTFKENCPDIRNSKVVDLYKALKKFNLIISIYDPVADIEKTKEDVGIDLLSNLDNKKTYDVIIISVAHNLFKSFTLDEWKNLINKNGFFYDIKGIVPREIKPIRL